MSKQKQRQSAVESPAVVLVNRYVKEAIQPAPRPAVLSASVEALSPMWSAAPAAISAAVRRATAEERTALAGLIRALASERVVSALHESGSHPGVRAVLDLLGIAPLDVEQLVQQVLQAQELMDPCPREVALGVLRTIAAAGGQELHPLARHLAEWDDAEVKAAATRIVARHRPPPPAPVWGEPEGYMSVPIHEGKRRLLLARTDSHGNVQVTGPASSDDEGIIDIDSDVVSKRSWRRWQDEQGLVACPAAYIRQRIEDAYQFSLTRPSPALRDWHAVASILGPPPETVLAHPVYDVVPAVEVTADLVAASCDLFQLEEVHHFTFADEWFYQAASKILGTRFTEGQRQFNLADMALEMLPEVETVIRPLLRLRLEDLAYVLAQTGRPQPARMALAVAVALGPGGIHPSSEIPFVPALCETTLGMMVADEDEHQHGPGCSHHHH